MWQKCPQFCGNLLSRCIIWLCGTGAMTASLRIVPARARLNYKRLFHFFLSKRMCNCYSEICFDTLFMACFSKMWEFGASFSCCNHRCLNLNRLNKTRLDVYFYFFFSKALFITLPSLVLVFSSKLCFIKAVTNNGKCFYCRRRNMFCKKVIYYTICSFVFRFKRLD